MCPFLNIEEGVLDIIKRDYPQDSRMCFYKMMQEWLKQDDPPPTWSAIIEAIEILGHESLARNLKDKYIK